MTQESVRHIIDEARQALVGKLPNPQDQIDAITYTLMYKFMSDIDDQSASLGGKRTFFSGDYEKYDWHELMRAEGQDQLILFREAIEKMSKNPNLPALFREIFNGAMLKFNDPRTLRLFLKEMDKFEHGHNDDLGDAYEYLLSIMSSQGGLGQFRTPRHIIEFIVKVVDPDKNDKIIDPACGTAGFLIEAYKHILKKHDGVDEDGKPNGEKRLTPTELDNIHKHFRGFDIDPTMIRTARVNMYLHGFKTPDIIEHDTLTSEDYWQDWYDVILANPPFMTPKGGIQPHKKFGVSANRAEVLFVDYIASHLKPNGRAGIIVPEGIIFQSGTAYKALRKNLVEDQGLVAVISLPSGVFQPYAGVKTSILILDRKLAATKKDVLFIKVSNDGFSLNTNRKPIAQNDLPKALEAIKQFQKTDILSEEDAEGFAQLVQKEVISENGFDLSGDKYSALKSLSKTSKYAVVKLADVIKEIKDGGTPSRTKPEYFGGDINWAVVKDIRPEIYETKEKLTELGLKNSSAKIWPAGSIIISLGATIGEVGIAMRPTATKQGLSGIIVDETKILPKYLYAILVNEKENIKSLATGTSIKEVRPTKFADIFRIPLPPLAVQEKIVAEIENKQSAINHAREIIKNLERERAYFDPRPRALRENWPVVKLNDILDYEQPTKYIVATENYNEGYETPVLTAGKSFILGKTSETSGVYPKSHLPVIIFDDFTTAIKFVDFSFKVKSSAMKILSINDTAVADIRYVYNAMLPLKINTETHKRYWISEYSNLEILLPPLEIQKEYVAEFEEEQRIIDSNRILIDLMESKISSVLSELWEQ